MKTNTLEVWKVAKELREKYAGIYRYGFNGKENDKSWGTKWIQDYGFRLYNPSIARFLSVDPLMKGYPMLTPYQFASNRPIDGIDLDGLEYYWFVSQQIENTGVCYFKLQKTQEVITMQTGVGPIDLNLKKFGIEGTFVHYNEEWKLIPPKYLKHSLNNLTDDEWNSFATAEEIESRVKGTVKLGQKTETAVNLASLADGLKNILKGAKALKGLFAFSKAERGVIGQAENILKSDKLKSLKDAAAKGKYQEVEIGGRTIAFDPEIPTGKGYFAVTNGKNGFNFGADAFSNIEELTKTVLHELHRLNFSDVVKTGSASVGTASSTTSGAHNFATEASKLLLGQ